MHRKGSYIMEGVGAKLGSMDAQLQVFGVTLTTIKNTQASLERSIRAFHGKQDLADTVFGDLCFYLNINIKDNYAECVDIKDEVALSDIDYE